MYAVMMLLPLALASMSSADPAAPGVTNIFCQSEVFKAACWRNEVVVMETALYGRMRLGRCVAADLGYIGCNQNVLTLADRWCSGKRSCEISVPNGDLDKTQPCFKELKTYLEASYKCYKVATAQKGLCQSSNYVKLVSSEGYIASSITQETGCGSPDTPWIIQVDPGQRINISLYDFNLWPADEPHNMPLNSVKYAVIRERALNKSSVITAASTRVSHAYLSTSNSIEVIIHVNPDGGRFMLHYTTVGCADLDPPVNGWFKRTSLGAVVGCRNSDSTWPLACDSSPDGKTNQWTGLLGNCTNGNKDSVSAGISPGATKASTATAELPYGVSVVIIIGIALAIGLLILAIGLLCFARNKIPRRRHVRQKQQTGNVTYKVYEKAPCLGMELSTVQAQGFVHHRNPVSINGNEYAHIWESPIPGNPDYDGTTCIPLRESAYGVPCECQYPRRSDLCLTKLSEEYQSRAECATLSNNAKNAKAEELYDRRFFTFDKEPTSQDPSAKHSPDILPTDMLC